MALIYEKQLSATRWLLSENNNTIRFSDDVPTRKILYTEFTYGSETPVRVYADPDGSIWYNVKSNVSNRLNNYKDDLDFSSITNTNLDTFFLNWDKIYLNYILSMRVVFDDLDELTDNVDVNFILGLEQVDDFFKGMTIKDKDIVVLSPLKEGTTNTNYIKYWDGYPLDIGFTSKLSDGLNITTIENLSTGQVSPTFNTTNKINRLVVTNGTTNITIEDYLPIPKGTNVLKLDNNTFIELNKVDVDCGTYIKWLNQYGSYSYWLFESSLKTTRSRNIGTINNDFYDIEDSASQSKSLGRTATEQMSLYYEDLSSDDVGLLEGISSSPKMYLYTGDKFSVGTNGNWIECFISNNNLVTNNFKNKVPNGTIIINLPDLTTITL